MRLDNIKYLGDTIVYRRLETLEVSGRGDRNEEERGSINESDFDF